jgi:hypothetical protein
MKDMYLMMNTIESYLSTPYNELSDVKFESPLTDEAENDSIGAFKRTAGMSKSCAT